MTSTRWAAARNGATGLLCFTIRGGCAPCAAAPSGCPDKDLRLRPAPSRAPGGRRTRSAAAPARPVPLRGSDPEAGLLEARTRPSRILKSRAQGLLTWAKGRRQGRRCGVGGVKWVDSGGNRGWRGFRRGIVQGAEGGGLIVVGHGIEVPARLRVAEARTRVAMLRDTCLDARGTSA